ncbi:ubiquitinyl hydrolase 1 [Trichuris suis]|nr:ubiquitinyl hydrolase 1 [Trichuris suis]
MTEESRCCKDLHLFKSLKQLQAHASNYPCGVLSTTFERAKCTIDRLYAEAVRHDEMGDEEAAYIYYYRVCGLLFEYRKMFETQCFSNKNLALTWQTQFVSMLSMSVSRANQLLDSLQLRYEEASSKSKNDATDSANVNDHSEQIIESTVECTVDEPEEEEEESCASGSLGMITCSDLYQLIQKDQNNILVIDVRDPEDFAKSKITLPHGSIVNIPPRCIRPGITSRSLEMSLKPHDRLVFRKRFKAQHVIVVDEMLDLDDGEPSLVLTSLNEALVQFDQCFRERKPKYLLGGFLAWTNYYPTFCTSFEYGSTELSSPQCSPATGVSDTSLLNYPKLKVYKNGLTTKVNEASLSSLLSRDTMNYSKLEVPMQIGKVVAPVVDRRLKPRNVPRVGRGRAKPKQSELDDNAMPVKYALRSRVILDRQYASPPATYMDNSEIIDLTSDSPEKANTKCEPMEVVDTRGDTGIDIAQSYSAEDAGPFSCRPPAVPDRERKPTVRTERDTELQIKSCLSFFDKSGSTGKQASLTGLINLGNTCYLSSVVQCMIFESILRQYFTSDAFLKDLTTLRSQCGNKCPKIALQCKALFEKLSSSRSSPVAPIEFKAAIQEGSNFFEDGRQQDAQEFMIFLFDALHEELNLASEEAKQNGSASMDQDLSQASADTCWYHYVRANRSFIIDLFQGQCRSSTRCLRCGLTSSTYDVYMNFSLPVPIDKPSTLQESFASFAKEEYLSEEVGWRCDRCKVKRPAVRQDRLIRPPVMLLVHLKRFTHDGSETGKIETFIDFPTSKALDLSPITDPGSAASQKRYMLTAVINHEGSASSGHYYSFCRYSDPSVWIRCDDEEVYVVPERNVCTRNAYMLFYLAEEYVCPRRA